jgi:methylated-DNA-protein-cysteine methyltransferase-like protein
MPGDGHGLEALSPLGRESVALSTDERFRQIWAVVACIPRGRVATYGQVAAYAGLPGRARQVGAALSNLPDGSKVPWHRVINARGEVSARGGLGIEEGLQRHRLEREKVRFDEHGRVDLDRFGWDGETRSRK